MYNINVTVFSVNVFHAHFLLNEVRFIIKTDLIVNTIFLLKEINIKPKCVFKSIITHLCKIGRQPHIQNA